MPGIDDLLQATQARLHTQTALVAQWEQRFIALLARWEGRYTALEERYIAQEERYIAREERYRIVIFLAMIIIAYFFWLVYLSPLSLQS